ncbi:hypothetical protein OEZ85_013627 [Tetradesmus obliquus]|uniref:Uncharacterized protein n=1 Tax=Tetradesmus obliquus TaxID=3088 RepID=A0ABY8UUM4_TETOB|nr:hypothetical protein OEZ85_013627 [Tetradesmus obliquus]
MAEGVPGFREQAKMAAGHVQATLTDKERRDAVAGDVTKHATELAALAKSHLAEPEKRSKLLEYARGFASQAVMAAKDPAQRQALLDKDPAQRQALLDKVNYTSATLFECIKDPAKRQEVHDQLAAVTHKLLITATAPGAAPGAEAEAPAGAPESHPTV